MKRYILFYLFLLSTISGYCQKSPFYNIDLQLDNTDSFIISANSYYALDDVKVINADWAYNGKKIKKGETIIADYIIYTIDDYILAGRKARDSVFAKAAQKISNNKRMGWEELIDALDELEKVSKANQTRYLQSKS